MQNVRSNINTIHEKGIREQRKRCHPLHLTTHSIPGPSVAPAEAVTEHFNAHHLVDLSLKKPHTAMHSFIYLS